MQEKKKTQQNTIENNEPNRDLDSYFWSFPYLQGPWESPPLHLASSAEKDGQRGECYYVQSTFQRQYSMIL